jgi:collagen type VII alpha
LIVGESAIRFLRLAGTCPEDEMRTSRLILAFIAIAATTLGCAQSAGVNNPAYGGSGGTNTGGTAGSTGGTGAGGSTGGTGAGGSTGGTGAGGSTGGTGAGGSTGGTGGGNCTPPVPGGVCDTAPQCGCTNGQACVVTNPTTGMTGCANPGNVQPNQNCSSGSCVAGYECVGSACKKYCSSAADCGGQDCIQVTYTPSGGSPTNIPGMMVCTSGCKLENPGTVCGSGLTCYQASQTGSATDCGPAGTGTGANGCTSADPTTCAPGYICLTDNSCAHWCRIGFSSDCPSGTCANLQTPPVINNVTYGVCQ